MRTCCCTLPLLNPDACKSCSYVARDGWWFIPFDPKTFDFEVGDDYYVIKPKKRDNLRAPWELDHGDDNS